MVGVQLHHPIHSGSTMLHLPSSGLPALLLVLAGVLAEVAWLVVLTAWLVQDA